MSTNDTGTTITIFGSNGDFLVDGTTGLRIDQGGSDEELTYPEVLRVNLPEYRRWTERAGITPNAGFGIDILDIGAIICTIGEGKIIYDPPAYGHREDWFDDIEGDDPADLVEINNSDDPSHAVWAANPTLEPVDPAADPNDNIVVDKDTQ